MTQHDFNMLVLKMRQAQCTYFKSDPHSATKREALTESKRLEKAVDEALSNYEKSKTFDNPQTSLFQ